MNKFSILAICSFFLLCVQMPYTFDRIDENKVRVIGVTVSPQPKVAPGDTVTVTAYFGGNTVTSINDIFLAYRVTVSNIGRIIPSDSDIVAPLQPIRGLPDSAIFSFVIKPDVFTKRKSISDSWKNVIDSLSRIFILPKDSLSVYISGLSPVQLDTLCLMANNIELTPSLFFTARSENGTNLLVKSNLTIKYRVSLPYQSPVNKNPVINWVGICKVPSSYAFGFSTENPDSKGHYTLTYLYNKSNTAICDSGINIDTGYAYFLATDNGITSSIDTSGNASYDTAWKYNNDTSLAENTTPYKYKWFYQNVNMVTNIDDSLMQIANDTLSCIEMKPPFNTGMIHFRVWVTAYSELKNQWANQRGQTTRKVEGVFRYSEAYKKKMRGK